MAENSKILVAGGTGYIGKHLVLASAKAGHPTYALVRGSTASDVEKSKLIESFKSSGVSVDICDHESLVTAIKQVDVVISAVGGVQLADQVKIIAAIKEAGNIKRFLPSEFGTDVDCADAVEPTATLFSTNAKIWRAIGAKGIPFTYVASNGFAGYFLPTLGQMGPKSPPRDKITIIVVFVRGEDIATYTIKAVDDRRTLNKILYLRPPANVLSFSEIVSLREKKIGATSRRHISWKMSLSRRYSPLPINIILAITHSSFVKGGHTDYAIDASIGAEASELYPEVNYATVDEYLSFFV